MLFFRSLSKIRAPLVQARVTPVRVASSIVGRSLLVRQSLALKVHARSVTIDASRPVVPTLSAGSPSEPRPSAAPEAPTYVPNPNPTDFRPSAAEAFKALADPHARLHNSLTGFAQEKTFKDPARDALIDTLVAHADKFVKLELCSTPHVRYFVAPKGIGKTFVLKRFVAAAAMLYPTLIPVYLHAFSDLSVAEAIAKAVKERGVELKSNTSIMAMDAELGELGRSVLLVTDDTEIYFESEKTRKSLEDLRKIGRSITAVMTGSAMTLPAILSGQYIPITKLTYPLAGFPFNGTKALQIPVGPLSHSVDAILNRTKAIRPDLKVAPNSLELAQIIYETGGHPRLLVNYPQARRSTVFQTMLENPMAAGEMMDLLDAGLNKYFVRNKTAIESVLKKPGYGYPPQQLLDLWDQMKPVTEDDIDWFGQHSQFTLMRLFDCGAVTGSVHPIAIFPPSVRELSDWAGRAKSNRRSMATGAIEKFRAFANDFAPYIPVVIKAATQVVTGSTFSESESVEAAKNKGSEAATEAQPRASEMAQHAKDEAAELTHQAKDKAAPQQQK